MKQKSKPFEKFEYFEYLIENPGFEHIVQNVFENLIAQDVASCRLVSKRWNNLILNNQHWWRLQLKYMETKKFLFEFDDTEIGNEPLFNRFPAWKIPHEHFLKNEGTKRLQEYVSLMWKYLNDKKAHNPLLNAAMNGNIEFVRLLIDTPTDFNAETTIYKISTPLHTACIGNQIQVIKLLIDNQAVKNIDFNARGSNGLTALHFACRNGSLEVVRLLIEYLKSKNIELFQIGTLGTTLFHQAVQNPDIRVPFYFFHQYRPMFSDVSEESGHTVIHKALSKGQNDLVNYLIDSRWSLGISLETRDATGSNVLHFAFKQNRHEILIKLLNALKEDHVNITLNSVNNHGMTPLHLACLYGRLEIVKLIFESKLLNQEMLEAVTTMGNNDKSALEISRIYKGRGYDDIRRLLLQSHIDFHLRKSVVLEMSEDNLSEIAHHMQLASLFWKELASLQ